METDRGDDSGDKDSPNELLQPEILSKNALVTIFKQRKVEIPDLENLDHGTLVDLFYKNIIPLPQRKYRHNRRGRVATKQQIISSKRKRNYNDINAAPESKQTNQKNPSESSRFICSYSIAPTGDRLKPPPSAINPERKIIKLKSSTSSSSLSNKSQDPKTLIINKFPSNANKGTKKTLGDEKAQENSAATLTKVLPNKDTANKLTSRIKLNRSSISLSSPEVSPAISSDSIKPDLTETEDVSDDTAVVEQEKNGEDTQSNGKDKSEESDAAVVRKKFKAVSVTWP